MSKETEKAFKWAEARLAEFPQNAREQLTVLLALARRAESAEERLEELSKMHVHVSQSLGRVEDERDAAEALAERRGVALRRYGRHERHCELNDRDAGDDRCSCGLTAALDPEPTAKEGT